jgi:hypothetical protein
MKFRQIVVGLLVLVFGFLAMSTRVRLIKSTADEANAQDVTPTPTPTSTPFFSVSSAGLLAFRANPGGNGDTNGVVLVVTSNATEQTSINFYYNCAPNSNVGTLGKCPPNGFMVFSTPVCTYPPTASEGITCPPLQ